MNLYFKEVRENDRPLTSCIRRWRIKELEDGCKLAVEYGSKAAVLYQTLFCQGNC